MNFLRFGRALSFSNFRLTGYKGILLSFVLAFGLRMIPEVLAFPYPISWDAIHYAYFMRVGVVWSHWSSFFTSTWLLSAFLFPLHNLTGVDSFLLLKMAGPILYGLNAMGIYWCARRLLGWGAKWSLLAAGFFAIQLASLRISWEFLRNSLGLGLLLFTLPFIRKLDSKRGFICFLSLSLLTVFAHESTAVTLLGIIVILAVSGSLKKEKGKNRRTPRLMLAILPALIIFLIGMYLRMFPIPYEGAPAVGPNVVWVKDTARQSYGKLFFVVNYLDMNTGLDIYPSYLHLVISVAVLFAVLYLPYFYLVWKGFFRSKILDQWTGLLLVASLNCLVIPFFALDLWHRWMFMLVYPFTFYAVNGMKSIDFREVEDEHASVRPRKLRKKVAAVILATVLIGAVYLAIPTLVTNIGFGPPEFNPIGRYFSIAPTVPYQDIDEVVQAMRWLYENMEKNSVVILHNALVAWARLYLESSHNVIGYKNDVNLAVNLALQSNHNNIYFAGWGEILPNWYDVYAPEHFVQIYAFERISVFKYEM